jgi:iron complex outermembrane receptor protein
MAVALLAGTSFFAFAAVSSAQAQDGAGSSSGTQVADAGRASVPEIEQIVVTARRRAEDIQQVPLVDDAVTSEDLSKLNILNMKDIAAIVPGLSLSTNANGIGGVATLRGVNFDVNSSGNSGTVQFYMNDQPVTPNVVLQSMYDIGQIEVLRGPQGTLRGRASPSGSITVTTKLPDLDDWGGYVDGTATTLNAQNVNGAVNIPLVPGKVAVRIAGLYDSDDANRVHSINDPGVDPYNHTTSERLTLRIDPTDNFEIIATVQNFRTTGLAFAQVESANIADPTQPASPITINPFDRKSLLNAPGLTSFSSVIYNLRAEWRFAGQKLQYTGSWSTDNWFSRGESDTAGFFDSSFPDPGGATRPNNPFVTKFDTTPSVKNYGLDTTTTDRSDTNEIRLLSDDPLFGMVDYVVGALFDRDNTPVHLWQDTPIYLSQPVVAPTLPFLFEISNIEQKAYTHEMSFYGNVNIHIDDATEISGGLRYINYRSHSGLTIQNGSALTGVLGPPGPLGQPDSQSYHPVIYTASIKHNFTDDLMVYVMTGTSWRPNAETNQIIDRMDAYPWGYLNGLFHLQPERSTSYEAGIKSEWLDRTLLADLTVYHQDYTNYFYSSPNVIVAARTALGPAGSLTGPNVGDVYSTTLIAPAASVDVPAKVDGVEAELAYQPLPNWSISGEASYSLGKIKNGVIPCNSAASNAYYANLISPNSSSRQMAGNRLQHARPIFVPVWGRRSMRRFSRSIPTRSRKASMGSFADWPSSTVSRRTTRSIHMTT